MIATIETLFADALNLPDETRLELVERLIPTIQSDPSLEEEQIQTVEQRMEQVRSGSVKTVSGPDIFREIEQSLLVRRKA